MVAIHHLFLLLILEQTSLSYSVVHHLTTNEEYLNLRADNGPLGVLYYHYEGSPDDFESRTKNAMVTSDIRMINLEHRFMKLATVHCLSKEITIKDIPGCANIKRQFLVYKSNSSEPKRFMLRQLYDAEPFISEMVNFIYADEISLVSSINEWEELQNLHKGKKDVISMHFGELGSSQHYEYMLFFLRNQHHYVFAFTTDENLANRLGKNESMSNGLWFIRCADLAENSNSKCSSGVFSDSMVIDSSTIESFINAQKLPVVSIMFANYSTIYDGIDHLNIMYIFIEREEEAETMTQMVYNVITRCKGNGIQLRGVIVDRRLHKNIMEDEKFSIFEDTVLPTAMVVLHSSEVGEIEPFIPDEDLVEDNLFGFVYKLVKNKEEYDNSIAVMNYIHCITGREWDEMGSLEHDTLIGVCQKDMENKTETGCKKFKRNFRHIVRTMYAATSLNFDYIYIDKTDNKWNGFEVPSIVLFLDGKIRKCDKEKQDIGEMLNWINSQLNINLPMLPFSGSDSVSLPPQSRLDENGDIIEEDYEEGLLRYQEDEVALSAAKVRQGKLYEDDDTLSLTDETFQETIMSKLLFAFFYMPQIDDVSLLVEPIIAAISKKVENDNSSYLIPTKVAKVNCENEFLACKGVHTFPTIRFYSEGILLGKYNGLLEEKQLMQTLRLYQQPVLQKLTENTLVKYIKSSLETSGSQLSVLGWFDNENEDFQLYKKASNKFFGKIAFAYATGNSTRDLFPQVSQSSTLVAYVQNQTRVLSGAVHQFTETTLNEFLIKAQVPQFGELTVENFPVYKSFNKSMLVLFIQSDNKMSSNAFNIISQLVKENEMEQLSLTWMNTDSSIGKEIRRSYLGIQKEKHEDIVIVNFIKGEVYRYPILLDNSDINTEKLYMWIQSCLNGEVKPTKYLNVFKWKPLRPGFDFLHMIDNNQRYPGDTGDKREDFEDDNVDRGAMDESHMHVDNIETTNTGFLGRRSGKKGPMIAHGEMDIGMDSEPQTSSEEAPFDDDDDHDHGGNIDVKQEASIPVDFDMDNEADVETHRQRNEL